MVPIGWRRSADIDDQFPTTQLPQPAAQAFFMGVAELPGGSVQREPFVAFQFHIYLSWYLT